MPSPTRKISKEEGVAQCVDFLVTGKKTADIVRELGESYGISRSTVEKWLQAARPMADSRRKEADEIRRREMEAAVIESARKHNITRESIQLRLWQIVNGNLQDFFRNNNNAIPIKDLPRETAGLLASIEVDELYHGGANARYWVGQTKKFKLHDPLKAADMLIKMNGWYKEDPTAALNLTVNVGYGKEVPV